MPLNSQGVMPQQENQDHTIEERQQRDLLACAVEIAPFIKGVLGEEVGFYIGDRKRFIYSKHGIIQLPLKVGDEIKEGSANMQALRSGARVKAKIGKELYDIPYIGTSYPITNYMTGEIIGVIGIVTPVSREEGLMELAGKVENQVNNIALATTNLTATSEELAATTEDFNNNVQNIKDKVQKTDSIVALIKEIAEQVHMLGLNAAIEAARVGEMGRGFNVVANEIRKMSQSTQKSAKEIMGMLQEIQQSILELTQSVGQIAVVTQQQAASTQEISGAVNELSTLVAGLRKKAVELIN